MGLEATTWDYFHKFDELTNITCTKCDKTYNKNYKPFFNIGGKLVCYFCINDSSTLPYPVHINYPGIQNAKSFKPITEEYKYK